MRRGFFSWFLKLGILWHTVYSTHKARLKSFLFRILPVLGNCLFLLELLQRVALTGMLLWGQGPGSRGRQRGEPAQSLCPYCLPWVHLRVWEHLAGWPPRSLPALVFSALTFRSPPSQEWREREGGQQRPSDCCRAHPAASLRCGLWLVSGSSEMWVLAPSNSHPLRRPPVTSRGELLTQPWEVIAGHCCTWEEGGFLLKNISPLAD